MEFFLVLFILGLIEIIIVFFKYYYKGNKNYISNTNNNIYIKKKFMSDYERYFYNIFLELESEFNIRIQPQVNLATVVEKVGNYRYNAELFRNIDFGIFSNDYNTLILLVEIDDRTHNLKNRKIRDEKVNEIVKSAEIRLIRFHSNYDNKYEYVRNRIINEIKNIRDV